jgi:CRISPR-associated protein Csm1
MAEIEERTLQAALAGLLHDIGKFAQRAGVLPGKHAEVGARVLENQLAELCPWSWREDIFDAVVNHHGGDTHKEIVKAVRVGDWLASADRRQGYPERKESSTTPLVPITTEVELSKEVGAISLRLPLTRLDLGRQSDGRFNYEVARHALFPNEEVQVDKEQYQKLWGEFLSELEQFPKPVDSPSRIAGLMGLMRRYMSHMPAATPWEDEEEDRTVPDVSLYDHSKVTAAVASCLLHLMPDDLDALHSLKWPHVMDDDRSVARMVRGDFSGIQSFIYRITTPESERTFRHTAKRLRGRSFYISLMAEIVADWLLRALGLSPVNALFIGGGRFDLLVPIDRKTTECLEARCSELEKWLMEQFQGVLGLEIVSETLTPADFADLRRASAALDDKMAEVKRLKLKRQLHNILGAKELEQVCDVCGLTPLPRSPDAAQHICKLCEEHKLIGSVLPRTCYIVRLYGSERHQLLSTKLGVTIDFSSPINTAVILLEAGDLDRLLSQSKAGNVESLVYALNDISLPAKTWPHSMTPVHTYLANAAPVSGKEVWEFDEIAECSEGAALIGVLKADVDRLGLIFSLGLEPFTMSRMAALSHTLDRFFSGYLNVLCQHVTNEWKREQQRGKECSDNPASLFYIVYAGGDDLLIIGPWDQVVKLAALINKEFRDYTCCNPNITLSAGVVMVKPHYPVQQFVRWVDRALNRSKDEDGGRDRLTIFNTTVVWKSEGNIVGFDTLYELAQRMLMHLRAKKLPRTLVHDLLRLSEKGARMRDGTTKPCLTPELLYLLTRRLPKEVRDDLKEAILHAWSHIRIPTSYVSLITRKE